ncbi:hypothetical protein OT109_11075 [Phycisphaeraceae bacterium D3-23]
MPMRLTCWIARPLAYAATCAALGAALLTAGQSAAQGQPVDRGTADLGPNSVSHRVVEPGIAQFSPEGALTDRYASDPATRLANLYHQPDAHRRYLYQAPGVTALYNQSDYITRDNQGVGGVNRSNAGNGQVFAIAPADIVYVLSPDLLNTRPVQEALPPAPGQIDRRMLPTAIQPGPYANTAGGQLNTRIDGHLNTAQPSIVDVQAIHDRRRGAQRDPRLVERARRWREERERAERDAREAEATQADEADPAGVADDAAVDETNEDDAGVGVAAEPAPLPPVPPTPQD